MGGKLKKPVNTRYKVLDPQRGKKKKKNYRLEINYQMHHQYGQTEYTHSYKA